MAAAADRGILSASPAVVARERFGAFCEEAAPLFEAHWREIERWQDRIPLQINRERVEWLERFGLPHPHPNLVILRFDSPLTFVTAATFEDGMLRAARAQPEVKVVLVSHLSGKPELVSIDAGRRLIQINIKPSFAQLETWVNQLEESPGV